MSILPLELWSLTARVNVQTYYVLAQVVKGLSRVHPLESRSWEEYFTVFEVGANNTQRRTLHGKGHSCHDEPAVVWSDGHQEWYQHGKPHRDGDKPAIIWKDGRQEWYQHGQMHRGDGKPAMVHTLFQCWYWRGMLHRDDDKPAIIWADGRQEWYKHGVFYEPESKKHPL